jgi:hypothetical protein
VKLHSENTLIEAERWIAARALMARIFARAGSANSASRWQRWTWLFELH